MTRARTAHAQVAFSNSPLTDDQSMPSMLWKAMPTAKRTPTSMPMLTRLSRLILSGGTSSTPVAVASSPRSALSALPWCLTPLVRPGGQRRRLHDRDDRRRLAPCRARRPPTATARSLPTSWALSTRSAASSRCTQYCSPLASAALKSSNATSPVVADEHAQAVEVAVGDPGRVQRVESASTRRASTASVTRSGASEPSGVPRGGSGDEHRGVGAADARCARGAPRARRRVRRASACSRCARPAGCGCRTPGTPGSWYIALCQSFEAMRRVALVAPERVDPHVLAGGELDVHHRGALDRLRRGRDGRRRRTPGR